MTSIYDGHSNAALLRKMQQWRGMGGMKSKAKKRPRTPLQKLNASVDAASPCLTARR